MLTTFMAAGAPNEVRVKALADSLTNIPPGTVEWLRGSAETAVSVGLLGGIPRLAPD
jgi:hypothetical protein